MVDWRDSKRCSTEYKNHPHYNYLKWLEFCLYMSSIFKPFFFHLGWFIHIIILTVYRWFLSCSFNHFGCIIKSLDDVAELSSSMYIWLRHLWREIWLFLLQCSQSCHFLFPFIQTITSVRTLSYINSAAGEIYIPPSTFYIRRLVNHSCFVKPSPKVLLKCDFESFTGIH